MTAPADGEETNGSSGSGQEQSKNRRPASLRARNLQTDGSESCGQDMKHVVNSSILRSAILGSTLASMGLLIGAAALGLTPTSAQQTPPAPQIWTVPEIGALPNDAASQQIRRGRDLITATYAHVGPEVADPAKRFAGNNLACANCHLEA